MERVEFLTRAYIKSYTLALNEVRNPELAAQIAMGVLYCLGQEQLVSARNNPLVSLFAAMAASEEEKDNDGK